MTYDCAAPASTPFDVAIGPMASAAGAPKVCSLRTIKSDVVVGLGDDGDVLAERLDKEEPGWKISGKYVRTSSSHCSALLKHLQGCCTPVRRSTWGESAVCLSELKPIGKLHHLGTLGILSPCGNFVIAFLRGSSRQCQISATIMDSLICHLFLSVYSLYTLCCYKRTESMLV